MKILIGIVLSGILLTCSCSNQSDIKFDSVQWKNWIETESTMSLRWDMRNDLIKQHELNGLSEFEIIELLGEPERKSEHEFRYYLGMARSGIDTGSLILTMKNGIVIDYRIWHG